MDGWEEQKGMKWGDTRKKKKEEAAYYRKYQKKKKYTSHTSH